jgi:peptidoglycan lytic transglycosylase
MASRQAQAPQPSIQLPSGVDSILQRKAAPMRPHRSRHAPMRSLAVCFFILAGAAAATARPKPAPAGANERLQALSRALRYAGSKRAARSAYNRLKAFGRHAPRPLAARAALALGYYEQSEKHYREASRWFERAESDTLLRQYALFWEAQSALGDERNDQALALLETFRRDFPESVLTEPALESLARAALAANQPQRALAALAAYPRTALRPKLLFYEAQALEKTGALAEAAKNYQAVQDRFPLADVAEQAGERLGELEQQLGAQFPAAPLGELVTRAEILYLAHRWQDARDAYNGLLPRLAGTVRERAELRIAECDTRLSGDPVMLATLSLSDATLDAERLAALVAAYRSRQDEPAMLAAVEKAVARDPQGLWAAHALFEVGNDYWVNLDRSRAAAFYRRAAEKFPGGKLAATADWRAVWTAYLAGSADRTQLLEQHIRQFPESPFLPDALYWLGRAAERANDLPHARTWYGIAAARFPQNYFGLLASERLRAVGRAPAAPVDLALAPAAPADVQPLSGSIPASVTDRWQRAQALRSIAFDASAELELKAAYDATGFPRLLFEAARAARDARQYMHAARLARGLAPDLEARPVDDAPAEIWRLVYPLPFAGEIDAAAARVEVDPMLLAGLVRQESGFNPEAVSSAGALGLTQLMPETARKEARKIRVRYSRRRLFEPEYNLRLGAAHLAGLLEETGKLAQALAAYNAGRDHVAAWRAGGSYDSPAEFVESIPFSETRQYVETVIRNAEVYRRLYETSR